MIETNRDSHTRKALKQARPQDDFTFILIFFLLTSILLCQNYFYTNARRHQRRASLLIVTYRSCVLRNGVSDCNARYLQQTKRNRILFVFFDWQVFIAGRGARYTSVRRRPERSVTSPSADQSDRRHPSNGPIRVETVCERLDASYSRFRPLAIFLNIIFFQFVSARDVKSLNW